MFDFLGPITGAIIVSIALLYALYRFAYSTDDKFSEEFRNKTHDSLRQIDQRTWLCLLLLTYDGIFRTSPQGRPRVVRCATISVAGMLIITIAWISIQYGELRIFHPTFSGLPIQLFFLLWFATIINVVGDYFSYWKTRYIIGRMEQSRSFFKFSVLLFLDLAGSLMIFLVGLSVGILLLARAIEWLGGLLGTVEIRLFPEFVIGVVKSGALFFSASPDFNVFGVFFFTSLLSSIWVWIYVTGRILIPPLSAIVKVLNVELYPVGTIVMIGGVVVMLVGTFVENVFL